MPANINVRQDERFLEITTSYFKLEYAKEKNFDSGAVLAGNNLRITVVNSDNNWYYRHPEVRNYFGASISLDEIKKEPKLEKGLFSPDGFVSIDDSNSYIISEDGTLIPRDQKRGLDIYLFVYRKDFGLCLRDYFMLTGKPPLIPRYALGNWWCQT